MPLSCCYVRTVLFFPFVICWGFCSKKLCTPDPYNTLEVSQRKSCCFALVFCFHCFSFGYVIGFYITTPSEYDSAVLHRHAKKQTKKKKHRFSKVWPLFLFVSLPLYLSEQVRVCCSSTNRHSSPLIYLSCRFISSSRRPDWGARTEPPG